MSFILDALKKAEAERQRQTGPTLLEVRVSAPRRRFPIWLLVIGGLLAINGVLLLVFLLRRPAPDSPAPAPVAAAPVAAAPIAAAPPAAPAPAMPTPGTPGAGYAAGMQGPVLAQPAAAPYGNAPYGQAGYAAAPGQPAYPPQPYAAQPYAMQPPAPQSDEGSDNPADYEPAVSAGGSARTRASEPRQEPPSLSQLDGNLPDLRLDMHVYSSRPSDRYALINMHRVHEGDTLPEGPRVVAIDRDGVELSYRGTEFMLHPQ